MGREGAGQRWRGTEMERDRDDDGDIHKDGKSDMNGRKRCGLEEGYE
jgi:hypothetical protein